LPSTNQPGTIIIIGGGPAGLMAADVLSANGHRVTIYDQMPSLGRKFLLAGRGGLNLTHAEPLEQFITRYAAATDWLRPWIERFSPADLRRFSETLGEPTFTGSSGRVFPKSFKTSPLLRAWLRRLAAAGVDTRLRHRFTGWNSNGKAQFLDADGQAIIVESDATILAMGGASWPRLGSDGRWTRHLAEQNVSLAPLHPANCGFETHWPDYLIERYAGAPLKSIAAEFNGIIHHGECIITATGLEGGLIYALSAPLREAILSHGTATVYLDLKPTMTIAALTQRLDAASGKKSGKQSLSNRLRKAARLPPHAIALLRLQDIPADATSLAERIKKVPITLTGIRPVERAISTAGGVTLGNLDANLMLTALPGVFAAGEMLDWEAPTGGYLLQACFATGAAAAHGALAWLAQQTDQGSPPALVSTG
jgi:uncharacterized flavoprotein (TIGR03862 family)